MSTNVGTVDIELLLNSNKYNKGLKDAEAKAKSSGSSIENVLGSTFKKVGGIIAAAFAIDKVVSFGKECLQVATDTSNAWIGLNSIMSGQGKNFNQAKQFIQEYVKDGLVPLNNAVASYKNLTLRGYNSEQIEKTMKALKNSATFARQSSYSLGDAVQTATEGLKNENSTVVDNAGVTKNVAKMWEDYAKSIGKTTNNLTQAEKIQAEVNGILEETKFQSNDAEKYTQTYSGKLAQLNSAFTSLKTAIGNVIQPIAKLFIPVITSATNAVTELLNRFSSFLALFGLKADGVDTIGGGLGDLASQADSASDAVSSIGDSAKKTKKQLQGLRGIDEINNLTTSNNDTSSTESGMGDTAIADIGNIADSAMQQANASMDKFINKAKELASIFKQGFDISFGNTNFDGILQHLNGVKETIINMWRDPDMINSVNQWRDTFLYSLGQVVGSVSRISINIAENIIGGIEKYLSQNSSRITDFITTMLDISSADMKLTGNFWQALGEISDVFKSNTAKQIRADIIAMFYNPTMSAIEILSKFGLDIKKIFLQPIIDNTDKVKQTFENLTKPIQTVTGTIAEAFTYIGDKWNEVYDTYIHPLMDSLQTGLSDTFSKFLDVYNQYVVPVLTNLANRFNELWNDHLKPFVDNVAAYLGSLIEAIQVFWENILKPLIDWLVQNVVPRLMPILETIWKVVLNVIGGIVDTIGGFLKTMKGVIDFIIGVFTGDWNKAWEGIKTIFSGIWDMIKGNVDMALNNVKDIVKGAIDMIKAEISSWGNTISSIWNNLWNGISNFISGIWNGINNIISTAWNNITSKAISGAQGAWNGIKNVFSSVGSWFQDTFGSAWEKVKNIFSSGGKVFDGIKDGIESTFKTIVNKLISGINKIISVPFNKIKSALDKIRNVEVAGFHPFYGLPYISTPSIPYLAQGGYVKANTPQLAMIGDNRHQGEVVAPEDKIHSIMAEELSKFKGNTDDSQVISLLKEILKYLRNSGGDTVLNVDSVELARVVIKGMKLLQAKSDKPILDFI